eukprot:m.157032 g.157032  ORF g.157032 m.157032 type:complete len:78 (+) comp13344_c0_seq29:3381-3614(+)
MSVGVSASQIPPFFLFLLVVIHLLCSNITPCKCCDSIWLFCQHPSSVILMLGEDVKMYNGMEATSHSVSGGAYSFKW